MFSQILFHIYSKKKKEVRTKTLFAGFLIINNIFYDSNKIWIHNHLVCKQTLNHLVKLAMYSRRLFHIYSNEKKEIRTKTLVTGFLSINNIFYDSNEIRTHNHSVYKRTRNHLVKLASLAKCLGVHLQTKWLLVQISLFSLKFRLKSVDSLWNSYVKW